MINTNNEFIVALDGGQQVVTLLPIRCRTRQQAYRVASWIKSCGEILPDEDEANTFDEIDEAIANT